MKNKKFMAFTLAEVLVTLAIIGVVAALTIPTVVQNYQKKMYVTGLKKEYNNITNGFKTYMAHEGVTKLSDTTLWTNIKRQSSACDSGFYSEDVLDSNKEDLKNEFLKIFKVAAMYGSENELSESQAITYKNLNGTETHFDGLNRGIFLADGSFLIFQFYKDQQRAQCDGRDCSSLKEFQEKYNTPTKLWEYAGSIAIDVNGAKGPNIFGRDLFCFWLGNDGMLYPMGGVDYAIAEGGCEIDNLASCNFHWKVIDECNLNGEGASCPARIIESGWVMDY